MENILVKYEKGKCIIEISDDYIKYLIGKHNYDEIKIIRELGTLIVENIKHIYKE